MRALALSVVLVLNLTLLKTIAMSALSVPTPMVLVTVWLVHQVQYHRALVLPHACLVDVDTKPPHPLYVPSVTTVSSPLSMADVNYAWATLFPLLTVHVRAFLVALVTKLIQHIHSANYAQSIRSPMTMDHVKLVH